MKLLKKIFRFFTTLVILIILFYGAISFTLYTKQGKRWVMTHLLPYVEMTIGTKIILEDFTLSFPLHLTLTHLSIQKENHPLIIAKSVHITCSFSHLVQGQLVITMTSPSVSFERQYFQDVNLMLDALLQPEFHGQFHLTLSHREFPIEAIGSFDANSTIGQLEISPFNINLLHLKTQGELVYYYRERHLKGTWQSDCGNVNAIAALFKLPLKGEAAFKFTFNSNEQFSFDLTGKDWKYEEIEMNDLTANLWVAAPLAGTETTALNVHSKIMGKGISWQTNTMENIYLQTTHQINTSGEISSHLSSQWNAENINFDHVFIAKVIGHIEMVNPLKQLQGNLQAHLSGLVASESYWEEVIIKSEFSPDKTLWPFSIAGLGTWKESIDFNIEGNWHKDTEHHWANIHEMTGKFGPYPFKNLSPIELAIEPARVSLERFRLQLNEGELQGSYLNERDNFELQFETNPLPSELFHFFVPNLPLSGRMSFSGQLLGSHQEASGNLKIDLHHVQIAEELFQQKPFIDGEIALKLTEKGVALQTELYGIGTTPFVINGNLPYTITLNSFQLKQQNGIPFHLQMKAEGELAPYMQLLFSDATNITGKAKIALEINGDIDAPSVYGSIDFAEGSYESLSTNTTYHHIEGRLEGNGSHIALSNFSAQDNKNGSFTASGSIELSPTAHFPFSFELHPKQIFLIDSDYAIISASGQLTVSGTLIQSTLAGNLVIDKGIIKLEENLPRSVKTVEVKYFNIPEGEQPPISDSEADTHSTLSLDIALEAPDNFAIRGNSLNSLWKGDVHIIGTPNAPHLFGELRIVKGEYNFNGKIFNLNPGNIHFAGPLEKKTTLYIVASKDIDRIRAEIILKGLINKPAISFRSNPPLSQREVLSYILFNRGISDITTDQGEQLNQSFIGLNTSKNTTGGDDFLSRMRNKIGLDRLDFSTGNQEGQDFSLQLGKNITENIFISLNQSLISAMPFLSVEIKLNKHLRLQADGGNVGDDNQFRTSLKWKKDY